LKPLDFGHTFLATPDIYEDESIRSYLQRAMKSSTSSGRQRLRELVETSSRLPWIFPSQIERITEFYNGVFEDTEHALYGHTCFPTWKLFLGENDEEKLYRGLISVGEPGLAAVTGYAYLGRSHRAIPTVCLSCVKEQIGSPSRETYWRRFDFLPGITVCGKHAEPLHTYCKWCVAKRGKSTGLPAPAVVCECGDELRQLRLFKSEADVEAEADISRIMVALTRSDVSREHSNGDYRKLLSSATSRMGLEGKAGKAAFEAWICERVGVEQVAAWRVSFRTQSAFIRGARGKESCRNPGYNAILIKALFGDFHGFKMALRETRIDTLERKSTTGLAPSESSARAASSQQIGSSATRKKRIAYWGTLSRADFRVKRQAMRRRVIELKEHDPEAGRTRLENWTRVFLAHFDGKWYDRNLRREIRSHGLHPKDLRSLA
jgi:hypothetical protein